MILPAVLGGVLTGKKMKSIGKALANNKGPSIDIQEKLNNSRLWNSIQTRTAVAIGIIFMMTVQPNLMNSIITIIAALIIGFTSILSKAKNYKSKSVIDRVIYNCSWYRSPFDARYYFSHSCNCYSIMGLICNKIRK